ncbi:hypothetical protein V2J09_005598 [Rumex salicifolius]
MDNMSVDMEKENQKQEDSHSTLSNLVLNVPGCKRWSMVKGSKPHRKLIFNFDQIKGFESWIQGLFFRISHGLHNNSIPKHVLSVDEMYLRLCLEAIHVSALKSSPCGISINSSPIYIQYLQGSYGSSEVLNSLEMDKFVIGFPVASSNADTIWGPVEQGVLGSITESNSMLNILKSPLFQRLSPLRTPVLDKKSFSRSNLTRTSGSETTPSSSKKLESDSFGLRYDGYRSDALQNSPASIASAHSVFTDQSSQSSSSTSSFQGMLQCTWKDDLPHFEFSIDDQKEIYVANAFKTEVTNDKSLDYVYSFHSKFGVLYDDLHGQPDIVGKMKVSTSLSLCPNNSKVAETEFVLFGVNEGQEGGDFQINSRIGKRRRRLSKVMEVLKPSHTIKRRSPTLFGGASTIFEERLKNVEEEKDLLQGNFLPELELAAIVVKDHIKDEIHHQEEEIGGWGLTFLKKAGSRQNPSQSCEECSTSIDIILPSGFHGRPATRNGGPSSILERWKSGGLCDCGGWDIGCPLTILKSIPRREDTLPHSQHSQKDCKSFDIFSEESEQGIPVVKMTNVHEGLYYITFRASLPILQCFSIAVAMVHSQCPELRPKHLGLQSVAIIK